MATTDSNDQWKQLAESLASSWQTSAPASVEPAMAREAAPVLPHGRGSVAENANDSAPASAAPQLVRLDGVRLDGVRLDGERLAQSVAGPAAAAKQSASTSRNSGGGGSIAENANDSASASGAPQLVRLDVERLAQGMATRVSGTQAREAANAGPAAAAKQSASTSSNSGGGGSVAADVLKTAGMVMGVGPLVTGLIKLFGSGGDGNTASASATLTRYAPPPALTLEAGVAADRGLVSISRAQNGSVRADRNDESSDSRSAPQRASVTNDIRIEVNAMDSRSFLDHSDEIAQAVRSALLRSHSLNDVMGDV